MTGWIHPSQNDVEEGGDVTITNDQVQKNVQPTKPLKMGEPFGASTWNNLLMLGRKFENLWFCIENY